MSYKTLSEAEKRQLLAAVDNEPKRPHAFTKKMMHWPMCGRCGLLALKNDATKKAIREGC